MGLGRDTAARRFFTDSGRGPVGHALRGPVVWPALPVPGRRPAEGDLVPVRASVVGGAGATAWKGRRRAAARRGAWLT